MNRWGGVMNKKLGFIVVGIMLLAVIVYFFYPENKISKSTAGAVAKKAINTTQVVDKEKQSNKKNKAADSLRNALNNAVQDSIDADIQKAVQSEIEKLQK